MKDDISVGEMEEIGNEQLLIHNRDQISEFNLNNQ
jgi:hypothetical protein